MRQTKTIEPRDFSASSIKYMRLFFDEWPSWFKIRHSASDELNEDWVLAYQTLRSIPKPYKTLAPVIEGVKRVLAECHKKS